VSFKQVSTLVAAGATTIALSAVAYADTGKSPNGAPGPAGNPNPPAVQPQANGPQGPAGNDARGRSESAPKRSASSHGKSNSSHGKSHSSHGKSGQSHGKSGESHGKSGQSHGKSGQSHGKSGESHGKSAKGKANNLGKGKITICHATRSEKNPYVEITISVNGLHGHGPADDSRHHEGSWQDIIPAPEGGCPSTAQQTEQPKTEDKNTDTTTTTTTTTPVPEQGTQAALPEVATQAPATTPGPQSLVLGARESGGGDGPKDEPKTQVLGANASGGDDAPAGAEATRAADAGGTLPFTGTQVAFVLIVAAVALLGGVALRRALSSQA
jgi:hypothetical protein